MNVSKGNKMKCVDSERGKVMSIIMRLMPVSPTVPAKPSPRVTLSTKKKHEHLNKSQKKRIDKLEQLEKIRNSEKMMDAFLASTSRHNEETNKNERAKTIIKTIRVSTR